ncbi:MAG: hypothetical protein L0L44_06755 [Bifidobacterium mongoliense]|uniref:hypothetical protein n=2 Tax=Bifidobacterium mongoliense TaxID=518643 RepID=UPI002647F153|nr:hypothetical protein [Bifidobacterium mongoliense]MDN6783477.1 hypothetical protein [Bifidobacterium mongoliense]
MALHPDITRKDDVSLALETAAGAMLLATRQQTGNAGSVTIPNADGTSTVLGAQAGGATVAKFVGKTTAPGRPAGITAESHMGTLFVAWDGTLDGGVDPSFLLVRVTIAYADDAGSHSMDLGDLRGAGSVGSTTLPVGTVVTVTARAYDDAHDASGLSRPNVSDSCDPITVTVVDEATALRESVEADIKVVSDKADKAQGVADDAADANTKLREDTAASLEKVNTTVAGVRSDVDKAAQAVATAQSGVDSANTKITQTSDKVDGLTTTVGNVSQTADSALSLSTQNHQDLTGFQQSVQQTYSTKEDTLSQVSAVSQKADSISATLSKDYQKKTDADATYATKTALQATANGINASVSETYATKSVVEALQNIADNAIETWQGHGVPSMTGEPASEWTTGELRKQHSGDMYYDLDTGYSYRFGSADGSTYTWDKISDSDITRAMQAAADAQSDADKANAGVSKLNTDIPATYATKSDVKITTDGIKTDVSKAMTLGQTGIDNAATVSQKADGIQATVTQQAQTISDNVKAIAQVNMRADSLSTSITQVNTKTDVALANAANYVKNPQFHGSNLDSVRTTQMDASDSNAGTLPAAASTYGKNTGGYDCVADAVRICAIAGHTYRIEIDSKPASDMPSTETEPFGLMYWRMAADNPGITADQFTFINTTATTVTDWTHSKMEFTYAGTEPWSVFRPAYRANPAQKWLVTNFACTDVTEVVAAQSSANGALSQASTVQQDLSSFKTSVGQTYETKTDSTAKNTALQQNLDGFKTSVASTYESKTDVAVTYATKSDVTQTSDSLTSKISAVGTDATSALNKATTAQQNLDGFKNTVASTYATKIALDSTNGNVSNAQNAASQALANAEEKLKNPTFKNGFDGWSSQWRMSTAPIVDHWGVSRLLPICDQVGGGYGNKYLQGSTTVPVNHGQVWQLQTWAKVLTEQSGKQLRLQLKWYDASGDQHWIWLKSLDASAKTDWTLLSATVAIPSTAVSATLWLHVRVQANDAVQVLVDSCSLKDVTEVAQLQSDMAATYATQSSVQQTSSQITQQVAATYATKDDVTSKYTTLQQTDSAFDARIGTAQSTATNAQSNASNAQNRAGVLETLIHSDANGVRVGKTVNGSYTGYSALVNANGSFDVLNPAGQMVSRFNSDGIQIPSGLVSVNGIPMVEDITDKLVFLNSYWDYRIVATRLFNMVTMQIWLRRCGDPNGDFVQNAWGQSWLFKIKKGWRPHGEPGNQNGQDIHFPAATNAVFTKAFSNTVFFQVTDTYIAVRSSMDGVKYVNGSQSDPFTGSWVSGTVSWMIDTAHQSPQDDSPVKN